MNRRHFFKLAAAIPVVGPAAVKAAAVEAPLSDIELMIRSMNHLECLGASRPTVFYVNRKVYEMLKTQMGGGKA